MDLRPFLGGELYLLLQTAYTESTNDFDDADLSALFFGVDYNNIRYYGLKPMLISFIYARLIADIQVNVTRAGVRQFDADQSEATSQAQISTKTSAAISEGVVYQEDARTYLKANLAKYPTWQDATRIETGFTWFKTTPIR